MPDTVDLCLIATITGFHGVRGGVTVQVHSDVPGRMAGVRTVLAGRDASHLQPLTIAEVREMPGKTVLTFEGRPSRNDVESMRGWSLYIPSDEMAPPPDGRHFIHELIGCVVHDSEGRVIGTLRDVLLLPGNDTYVVDGVHGEILVPAVPEFITSVDTGTRVIVVRPIVGLLDEPDEV